MNMTFKYSVLGMAITGVIGLTGCGGGGSGDGDSDVAVSPSSQVTSGTITGFGSVYVDGVEFETDGSSFSLDDGEDGSESEDELEIGMVVTVTGSVDPGGKTGRATHIEYDDELEGIVNANNVSDGVGTLTVMGQTVHVNKDTEFENDDGIAGIDNVLIDSPDRIEVGNIVEVSGYPDGKGSIYATFIELEDKAHSPGNEIEVKGLVVDDDDTDMLFMLGDLTVDFSNAQLPDGLPVAGDYVEVESTAGYDTSGHLIASDVELEDDMNDIDGEAGVDAELNGTVTAVEPDVMIGLQKIIVTDSTTFEHGSLDDMVVGAKIEVEGYLNVDKTLVAEEIEFSTEDDHEVEGLVEEVTGSGADGSVKVVGLDITINSDTVMIDEQDDGVLPVHYFGLDDLGIGDFVEIDYYLDSTSGNHVATRLEREDKIDE